MIQLVNGNHIFNRLRHCHITRTNISFKISIMGQRHTLAHIAIMLMSIETEQKVVATKREFILREIM